LTISLYLGNLTYSTLQHPPQLLHLFCPALTFSKITRGPLTPPMVLYLILGVTLYDDDSLGSPMVADVSEEGAGIREASALTKLRQSQIQSRFECGELSFVRGGWRSGIAFREAQACCSSRK
jgi:hypothetical protein